MAAILILAINGINGGTRTLLLVLLIVALVLIVAGAVIAVFTFAYARRQRASLDAKRT